MNTYERYKALKSLYDYVYCGIHVNRVTTITLWNLAGSVNQSIWKSFLRLFCLLDVSQLKKFDEKDFFVMKGRYNRKDHTELLKVVLQRIGYSDEIANAEKWHSIFCFHPVIIFRVYFYIFSVKHSKLTLLEKCVLANEYVYYCNTIKAVKNNKFQNLKKFLCLVDTLEIENLLTQFFNLKGVQTFSLSEGVYFAFKDNIPFDVIGYENLTTNCKICWGEYSKNELLSTGVPSEKIVVGGFPKDVIQTNIKHHNTFKKCMVLLARDAFRESNMCLLNILSDCSNEQEIYLKLHPRCDLNYYQKYANDHNMKIVAFSKTINECLDQKEFDYAIAVNTTAYYEALMRGIPCFRLDDGKFNLMHGMNDTFGTLEEFNDVYNKYKNINLDEHQKQIDNVLKYTIGFGIDNYREIILGADS